MRRFSSAQVTVLLVVAMLCLAVPATTVAAGIGKVQISNSKGKAAKVKAGRLQVAAQVKGTVKTAQQGPVTSQQAPPRDFVTRPVNGLAGVCAPLVTAPAGADLVVRQLRVNTVNISSPGAGTALIVSGDASCGSKGLASLNPDGVGLDTIAFDPGVGVPSGTSLYAVELGPLDTDVFVDGYLVAQGSTVAPQ